LRTRTASHREKSASADEPHWPLPLPEDDEHLLVRGVGGNLEEVTSVKEGFLIPGTAVADLEGTAEVLPVLAENSTRKLVQPFERIGLEAGPLSQWIYAGLVDVGLAAIDL
jgi:hypothetical protein